MGLGLGFRVRVRVRVRVSRLRHRVAHDDQVGGRHTEALDGDRGVDEHA